MRKIYSLVLMATMLLMGTNAWAEKNEGEIALQNQINALRGTSGTITLSDNVELTAPLWIGAADGSEAGLAPNVVLDLGGNVISMTVEGKAGYMFVLGKGTLEVKNGYIKLLGTPITDSNVFSVYGTYNNTANYSHLIIGAGADIAAQNGTIIAVLEKRLDSNKYIGAYGQVFDTPANAGFLTTYRNASYGFAMGVVVDVKGGSKLNVGGVENGKTYGIKVNGLVDRPKSGMSHRSFSAASYEAGMSSLTVTNDFEANVPYVHVWPNCSITSSATNTKSAAIYASGYGHWLIEGYCEGNIGASISSGEVAFNNAEVKSNSSVYNEANGENSVSGNGIGILVNSRNQNAGDIDVVISGETKVSTDAPAGVAVQEQITSAGETKVESISVESGSFTGGTNGAIIVTNETTHKTTIYDADIQSTAETPIKVTGATDQAEAIANLLPEGTDVSAGATQNTQTGKWEINFTAGYDVQLNAAGLATFSADKRTLIPAGVKVYKAGSMSGDYLSIAQVNENGEKYIPANTGVLLFGEANASISMAVNTTGTETVADFDGNKFHAATEWAVNDDPETKDIIEGEAREDAYILHDSELWQYTGANMKPNKAYLLLSMPGGSAQAPKRIRMAVAETQGFEQVDASEKAVKFLYDGQVYIKRGEKVYNLQGQVVK